MFRKIFLAFSISVILFTQVFANFSSITEYNLFFQNKNTNEQKYINTKTHHSRFFFNYFLLKYINWSEIWGESKLQNWKLIKIEKKDYNDKPGSPEITNYFSWKIRVYDYWINLEKWNTWALLYLNNLNKLTFQDLTSHEKLNLFYLGILDFFWFLFFWLLPLNIIIFFCFWYLLFSFYEKYWLSIFKYIYLNSFIVYLITYIILIFNWLSFPELLSLDPFWIWAYSFFVWLPKFILYLFSLIYLKKYHEKYPEKKVIYKYVIYWYILLFCLFSIIRTQWWYF